MSELDPKLIEALRLLVERPEVLQTAIALAKVPTPAAPKPTLGELWEQAKDQLMRDLGGERSNSWRTAQAHRSVFGKTKVVLDDGRELLAVDLPWDLATPRWAELYRAKREATSNGRKKRDGSPDTVKPSTVNRELSTIQSLFNVFVRVRKTLPRNPIEGWQRADEEPYQRQTYLTDAEVRQFIEAGPPSFQDICTVAWRCAGMRQSEARLLKKSEIDWSARVVNLPSHRTKKRRARVIPFPDDVEPILEAACRLSRGSFVFVNPRDPKRLAPISANTWQGWLVKARNDSGVVGFDEENVVTHHLRHKAVTDLLQAKEPATSVMAAAGMCPATLKRYAKFSPEQQNAMRATMNRMIAPPEPITGALKGERKSPAHLRTVRTDKASSSDV